MFNRGGCGGARQLCAGAGGLLLSLLVACGGAGSGTGEAPRLDDVPAVGTVSIPIATLIDRIDIGDEQRVIDVMPGDRIQQRLFISQRDPADQYDVVVLEGGSFLSVVRDGERWILDIDARALAAGTARGYRLQIRHHASGESAELHAPVRVATPRVRAAGTIDAAGGTLTADDGSLRLTFDPHVGAAPLGVQLVAADVATGRSWRIVFDRDVSADTRLLRIETPKLDTAAQMPSMRIASADRLHPVAAAPPTGYTTWLSTIGSFTTSGGYRLPDDKLSIGRLSGFTCTLATAVGSAGDRICVDSAVASMLSGSLPRRAPQLAATDPVLFVHGYEMSPVLNRLGGGGWGQFPTLIERVPLWDEARTARAFTFQWVTNASFAQVARELAAAVTSVHTATGRPVTVVAHSFGGVLVRSMLQLHDAAAERSVAQVVTLGSPHSGILPIAAEIDGVRLPVGLDLTGSGAAVLLCDQISCFEMGGPRISPLASEALGLSTLDRGYWTAALARVDAEGGLPDVPIVVGIGLGLLGSDLNATVGVGDGLISFEGQRFAPARTTDHGTGAGLLDCDPAARPQVREVVLSAGGLFPGEHAGTGAFGVVHTGSLLRSYSPLLRHEPEAEVSSAVDASFQLVASVLRAGVCPQAPTVVSEPTDVAVILGQPATFAVAVAGRPAPRVHWRRDATAISGANTPSYRIDVVAANDDGALFSAVIENPSGTVESRAARLTVLAGPPVSIATGPAKDRLANCSRPCVLAARADGSLVAAGADPDADGVHPLGSPQVAPGPWFPLRGLPSVRQITSGAGSSMLAGTDGSLWVTGDGSFGKLGDGGVGSATWKVVDGISDVRSVVGRGITSYALTGTGRLWVTGANTQGQTGMTLPAGQTFLTRWTFVPAIADAKVVASNGVHTLVLRADKTVWAAGQNSRGSESVLGFGAGGDVLNIREWRAVPALQNIVDIATGSSHSLALTEGGRVWASGDSPSGTFSSFGWTPQLTFAEVPGIDDVKSIAAANSCSMAIKSDGSLWVAGLFGEGATGGGAGAAVSFPAWTRITTAPPLVAVQTDCTRSLAIDRDGWLHATGSNELGGIGLGNPQADGQVPRAALVWTRIDALGNGF